MTTEPRKTPHRWSPRLAELGVRWRLLPEPSHADTAAALRERIKELNGLYAVAQLEARNYPRLDDFLSRVVDVLPPSFRWPELACARLELRGREYVSLYYEPTGPTLRVPILAEGRRVGELEVSYAATPVAEEPFLDEEKHLMEAVAERIGAAAERHWAENSLAESHRQLTRERHALREANAALRTVLTRIEEEKETLRRDVHENVERMLMPLVREMELILPEDVRGDLRLLKEGLEQIASPFVRRLSRAQQTLTPTEIRICEMIRGGMSTKDIARVRAVSPATVNRQRESIRRKLGIAGRKVNLATYLQSEFAESGS